ncbi:Oligopeptide transport ATP-binding protein OppF (TC 3.A.1.5.1) [Microbacterium esteraromaticum]|uniref:Oligopeptide transport ATP-binding protein OppF (TC 3.A.1.5.1) n=1 Tax=Microbacterium esteraromaticum TaxID=57043 RepID=A0A1R4JZG5_9MICO|nr:ABC transporter ATP-binding protein [Microbacterium esteraromaticum]SJN37426.1 Oligopeptide transport ATP-binding protein OppF (TC 3.A.1.5.1) [Microbacterium esteraromaticum]
MAERLLEVTDLVTTYSGRGLFQRGPDVRAVDGISLTVDAGEVLAIVGESGCGKTSTVQTVLRMVDSASGSIVFEGEEIAHVPERALRTMRRGMQMIYQDPYESLDPRFTVHDTMVEPLLVHERRMPCGERERRIADALETVGLSPAEAFLDRYPHELSGGQRQRVAIAAALVMGPRLLIADEPVSMLDVSVRAGILDLLASLCGQGLGIVMITHDLSTAARFADRIAVMYLGRIVEEGAAHDVIHDPQHPYTRALLSVVPQRDPLARTQPVVLTGEAPNAAELPSGCRFHPRCPIAIEDCRRIDPALDPVRSDGHLAACILAGQEPAPSSDRSVRVP